MAERSNYCDDQDLRSLPRICERKIKSLAIPYESPIQVHKRRQLFIRSHNETLTVAAMRVCNR
jgi:hypothetical protein